MGRTGFEPVKTRSTDLQSVLVGRLSISPKLHIRYFHISTSNSLFLKKRAGEGTRTPDLLITSQLLYQLSYTG